MSIWQYAVLKLLTKKNVGQYPRVYGQPSGKTPAPNIKAKQLSLRSMECHIKITQNRTAVKRLKIYGGTTDTEQGLIM